LAIGAITTLVGLAAVVSSFSVYMIPTQPAWNSGWLPISFVGTLLLFAGVVPASLIQFEDKRFLRILLGCAFAGGVALLVSTTWMIAALSRFTADDFSAARLQAGLHLLGSNYSVWFGSYLFLAILLPFAFALRLWPRGDFDSRAPSGARSLRTAVFLAALCGAIIGRMLMYAIGTAVPSF
jgi:anaerobic dimethyl sulfoxide reductase subunit C (anchor subunit)